MPSIGSPGASPECESTMSSKPVCGMRDKFQDSHHEERSAKTSSSLANFISSKVLGRKELDGNSHIESRASGPVSFGPEDEEAGELEDRASDLHPDLISKISGLAASTRLRTGTKLARRVLGRSHKSRSNIQHRNSEVRDAPVTPTVTVGHEGLASPQSCDSLPHLNPLLPPPPNAPPSTPLLRPQQLEEALSKFKLADQGEIR